MSDSQRIALSLYHRDHLSQGRNRQMLGYEAYHWGVFVTSGPDQTSSTACESFDATDAAEIDPVTWRMSNPTMDWWLRIRPVEDFDVNSKLLGCIDLGEVRSEVSRADIKQLLEGVPLPVKNTHPQQSCVTWAVDAVSQLRERKWLSDLDIEELKEVALTYADKRLKGEETRKCINHPSSDPNDSCKDIRDSEGRSSTKPYL